MKTLSKHLYFAAKCLLAAPLLLAPSGCTVGPKYDIPTSDSPPGWKTTKGPFVNGDIENWWDIFCDPVLDELEKLAIESNKDLEIAMDRILEERAQAGIKKADLFPQLDLKSNYYNTCALIKVFGLPAVPGFAPPPNILRVHELFYTLTFQMQYEMDLWGKYRNQYKAGLLKVESVQWAYCSALLSMTTDLASNYFQMRSLDSQIEILENTIASRNETVKINTKRYEKSLANYTDVSRAEVLLYNAMSELSRVKRERVHKENLIAVLIGIPASELRLQCNPLYDLPPKIPAGIPSNILLKRPDIQEAERMAASEHAMINSAYASLFPTINLTGAFGTSTPILRDFLDWKSRIWTFVSQLDESIFDGWRNLSNIDYTKAKFLKASAEYQKRVLGAFSDVENALANIQLQKEEMESLEMAIAASEETTKLSEIRYYSGLVNYLEVADSERAELELQRTEADLLGWRYVSTIQLVKSLGGRW